mgnify:CR=1 FL=1
MIDVEKFFNCLKKNEISFFTGVPDSVLKDTNSHFKNKKNNYHFVTGNEGSAVALAIGYFLSTNKIPCVYMQNSGLGNAINPLISIAHKKIYSIPMLLLVGWRGTPGIKDEPQHMVKGAITIKLLKLLNIKYCVIKTIQDFKKLKKIITYSRTSKQPVACLISKGILKDFSKEQFSSKKIYQIKRSIVIKQLLKDINLKTKIIATTGFTSRELYQIRINNNLNKGKDFYMVGGMGHSSMVALGVAMNTNKEVICLDGDGSLLMHLGSVVSVGNVLKKNFKHILLNNFSHESVGGQTTNINNVNIKQLVLSVGYKNYFEIKDKKNIILVIKKFLKSEGPSFLEVKIDKGTLENLTRPRNLLKIKKDFEKNF